MIKRNRRRLLGCLAAVASLTSQAGCFFPSSLEVTVLDDTVFISTTAGTSTCDTGEDPREFECVYFEEGGISRFTLSDLELAAALFFLDPLILQVPSGATNFQGSFLHTASGTSAPLAIAGGLSTIRADATRTISAEPGTQLVVIDLPPGAPSDGSFAFNFNFRLPAGATQLAMKGLFAGRVGAGGQTFFPPTFPCVTDFAAIPPVSVPLPAGGLVTLPLGGVQGCAGEVYSFGQPVPTLPQWGLILLALTLAAIAAQRMRRISVPPR